MEIKHKSALFFIVLIFGLIGGAAHAACPDPPNDCCPAGAGTTSMGTCSVPPSGVAVTATSPAAGEITCKLEYVWNWVAGSACSTAARDIRYCLLLKRGDNSPDTCSDDAVQDFWCEDINQAWLGAGTISFEHTFDTGLTSGDCYYCEMKAIDHATTNGGGSCPACTQTNCFNGGNCTTTLAGGNSVCEEAM